MTNKLEKMNSTAVRSLLINIDRIKELNAHKAKLLTELQVSLIYNIFEQCIVNKNDRYQFCVVIRHCPDNYIKELEYVIKLKRFKRLPVYTGLSKPLEDSLVQLKEVLDKLKPA